MRISIIGAGRTGTALAVHWKAAGHEIAAVAGRAATRERAAQWLPGVQVLPAPAAARLGDFVVLGVPDDLIEDTCIGLNERDAWRQGRWVAHLSGATSLDVLETARESGAGVMSLHPLQTFPNVDAAVERLTGTPIAVTAGDEEGYELGEQLALDAAGIPFRLPDEVKSLYHAAAVFASNYLIAVTAEAEVLFRAAGLPEPAEVFMPLARASFENAVALGPEAALTGPAARGDAGTIARNLEALRERAPEAIPAYVALARVALDLAQRNERIDAEQRASVDEVLAKWS